MKIAILGGTGYLGSYLVDALIARGHQPVLLVRPGSQEKIRNPSRCISILGEIHDKDTLRQVFSQCQAVIYNIGILREFPRKGITFQSLQYQGACRAIDIATELGIERFLLTSANGVKPDGTPYQHTKYLAEKYLRSSQLQATIFRPSVIFGDPRGHMEFATQLCDEIIRSPLPAPLFHKGLLPTNAGTFRVAPIHVKDVADIYVKALEDPNAIGKTYPLCGPDAWEWRLIIKTIGRAIERHKWTCPVPVLPLNIAAAIFETFPTFPITRDQLTMLLEGNTGDSSDVFRAYQINPTPFDETSLSYLRDQG
uniref:NADH dehydrogenase n=1 Tax=Candidatus Kentrum sp. FW TaxID=2126338 RepID=A0A450SX72_9GAMM|nr:MAG: NADH dehydrogenase [Candidatus Kentron sp. FW]